MTAELQDDAPPNDALAEQSVLGAMLLSPLARAEVIPALAGPDFYKPAHEAIFDAVCTLDGRGEPADPVTVMDELRRRGDLDRVGGPAYLHTLMSATPTAGNATYYARIVRRLAVLRRLANAGVKIAQLAREAEDVDLEAVEAAVQHEIALAMASAPAGTSPASTSDEVLAALVESLRHPLVGDSGLAWGWRDVDEVMNGLTPGKLVVIGARPAIGKSLVIGCLAASAAYVQHQPTLLHTLEMTRQEVMQRLLAGQANVDLAKLIRHDLDTAQQVKVHNAVDQMRGKPLVIDETRGLTPLALRASIRRQNPRPALVLVDYLQLMRQARRAESRLQEVSSVTRELKEIAGDEETCMVAAAQLNRNANGRLPTMSDLRESGEIEQSADDVVLLHRETDEENNTESGELQFIVAKQRQGRAGITLRLADQAHYGKFSDMGHY